MANWRNDNGGVPYVFVECQKCKGGALIEQPTKETHFSHCGVKEKIPEAVLRTYLADLQRLHGKPAGREKGRVYWI
jgi:hypothetical protein